MEKNIKSINFKKRTLKEAFEHNDYYKNMEENPFIKIKISSMQFTKIFSKMNLKNEIKRGCRDDWSQIIEYINAKILYKFNYHYEKYLEHRKNKKKGKNRKIN